MRVEARIDTKEVNLFLQSFPKAAEKVVIKSINQAAAPVMRGVPAHVRREYHVAAKPVKESVAIEKATVSNNEAVITAKSKKLPLKQFGTRGSKKGVSTRVKRKGQPSKLRHAFIGKGVLDGHVMERVGRALPRQRKGRYTGPVRPRLPISKLYGPAVPWMVAQKMVKDEIIEEAQERFYDRFHTNMLKELEKYS